MSEETPKATPLEIVESTVIKVDVPVLEDVKKYIDTMNSGTKSFSEIAETISPLTNSIKYDAGMIKWGDLNKLLGLIQTCGTGDTPAGEATNVINAIYSILQTEAAKVLPSEEKED